MLTIPSFVLLLESVDATDVAARFDSLRIQAGFSTQLFRHSSNRCISLSVISTRLSQFSLSTVYLRHSDRSRRLSCRKRHGCL